MFHKILNRTYNNTPTTCVLSNKLGDLRMKMGIKLLENIGPKVNKNKVTVTEYGHFVYWIRVKLK